MIKETTPYRCHACESADLIKNGHSGSGKQQYICKACGRRGVINARKAKHSEAEKEQIPNAYLERPSMRGICRIFNVSRPTLAKWLKKALLKPEREDTLLPAACHLCPRGYDVLELDEVWSFVKRRANKRWLWVALCRRTRQVVAYVIGDRGEKSCQTLYCYS